MAMSYAALMVHIDASRSAWKRAQLAAELAGRYGAALIGVAGRSYLPSFLADGHAVDSAGNDSEQREMTALLADLGKKFCVAAKHVKDVEWRGIVDYANNLIPLQARAADLIVVGREQSRGDMYFSLDPGAAILRAGRPVLVVPDEVDSLPARRVVVAWKDTREARRAVHDAIPFLKEAEDVMIVTICESGTEEQAQKQVGDIESCLRRHKVVVKIQAYLHTKRTVAAELLRFAKDEKANLIVAGGYGHSRLGEWMLGGVTRDLLSDSPVCCLFSH
jgi:nucleotide-binding universal stress UspA family protein